MSFLDVDAGVDDALAIILVLRSPELRVEAITTVAGNANVTRCTRNVHLVIQELQLPVPTKIAQGSTRPLSRPLVTAQEVHGRDGLGNVTSRNRTPGQPVARDRAVDVILNVAREYPHKVTLIATGPLTKVARAFQKSKKHFALIRELIIMGVVFYAKGKYWSGS
ncbi:MAG: nucleoside hydrolase [Bacteroidota bacterium]